VARAEIVEAARAVLEAGETLSVAAVMARSEMTRKAFYVHFRDLGELVVALVRPLRAELDAALLSWADDPDPVAAGRSALGQAAVVYTRHAALLRSVWGAAPSPDVVAAREELIAPLVDVGERLIRTHRGLSDAREVARVLAGMNVHALLELDAPQDALVEVWASVLGVSPRSSP
jgi:TetR/AcrR family transcriptional regulator, ethionamide resistance regulator